MVTVARSAALAAVLYLVSAAAPAVAVPAALGGGLAQLEAAWELGSPNLPRRSPST